MFILPVWWALAWLSFSRAAELPSLDPFYQPDIFINLLPPGTILRVRPIIPINLSNIPQLVTGVQLQYRTRSINGTAVVAVTTVLTPHNARPGSFVSFQFAEDSASVNCAPSFNLQQGKLSDTNPTASFEYNILQTYLASGYLVAVPDYQGSDAAFGAGRLAAYHVLDGMRAVSNFLGGRPAIAGVGYSGGAIATGWAASLHSSYAPELDVKAWSIGGTPANLTATMTFIDNTDYAGLVLVAMNGLNRPSSYQTVLDPLLKRILTPYGKEQMDIASNFCAIGSILSFANRSVLSYDFQSLGPSLLTQPEFDEVMSLQTMGTISAGVPKAPVLLYHAIEDQIIPYKDALTLYHSWCKSGADVHFESYTYGDHIATEILGLNTSIQFVGSSFANTISRGCSIKSIEKPTNGV